MGLTLYYSPTSPFARKVRIALIELGLHDRVEEIAVNPFEADADYLAINPLSKIPTLITEDGVALPDSRNILDYVLSLGAASGRELAVADGDPWADRRRRQLADGLIDAAVAANLEQRRAAELVSKSWFDRQVAAVTRTLDSFEVEADALRSDGPIGLTEISLITALQYLDLRLPDLGWRAGHPLLVEWFSILSERQSSVATAPA